MALPGLHLAGRSREGEFQTLVVLPVEAVALQGTQRHCRLYLVLEVHEAEEVLAAVLGSLRDQSRAQEAGERSEHVAHFPLSRIGRNAW